MAPRIRAASTLSVILFVAFALELITVLTVPVTKSIALCTFEDYKYGVFGYCNMKTNVCTSVGVGYSIPEGDSTFKLPSSARKSLSNLLVVHVVATGVTLLLFIFSVMAHFQGPASSHRYLLCVMMLVLPAFVLSLLTFLVDILLFVSHLDWAGWLMLVSTVLTAIAGVVLCIMRRTLSSQKAMRRRMDGQSELHDMASFNTPSYVAPTGSSKNGPLFSEINLHDTNTTVNDSTDDIVPLNRPATSRTADADLSYTSGPNDSATNIYGDRTPSPSREYRYAGTNMSYRGARSDAAAPGPSGYMAPTENSLSNQLEFSPAPPAPQPNAYGRSAQSTPVRQRPPKIPAGSYIPGVEGSTEGFGPNVVPLPKIRDPAVQGTRRPSGPRPPPQSGPVAMPEFPASDTPAAGTAAVSSAYDPREDFEWQQQQQQAPQPRQTPQQQAYLQQTPQQQTPQQQPPQQQTYQPQQSYQRPVYDAQPPQPPQPQYRTPSGSRSNSHQQLRKFFVEEDGQQGYDESPAVPAHGYGSSPPIDTSQDYGSSPNAYGSSPSGYGDADPPLAGHFQREMGYAGPLSPASDASSHYTSVSQRTPDVRYMPPRRGPDRSDFVLQNNPDFNLGVPNSRKNGGRSSGSGPSARRNRPPPPSAMGDSPYGASRG